jgi:Flp pilus assembly protein TadG
MLIQFALLLFGIFGLAALCIDMAYVSLTRIQMQSAVESAALEGLRQGRQAASDRVSHVFDDDFHPENGDPFQFGAGPVVTLSPGTDDDLSALQQWSLQDPPVYKPTLKTNATNDKSGDMVVGTYDPAQPHGEDQDYTRKDFNPTAGNTAFLVRMRRSKEFADPTDSVGSAGGTLPFLFGRGTAIHGDPDFAYSPRRDGITVRATAIADARKVLRVGLPQSNALGVTPFVLTSEFWATLSPATPTATVKIKADIITTADGLTVIGRFVAQQPTVIGTEIQLAPGAVSIPINGYVPIYKSLVSSGKNRVVGFGAAQLTGTVDPGFAFITLQPVTIAQENATAHLLGGFPPMSADELSEILQQDALANKLLLAPVIVR